MTAAVVQAANLHRASVWDVRTPKEACVLLAKDALLRKPFPALRGSI